MKKEIRAISIGQSSKMIAILSCIISAIYAIPFGIYELINHDKELALAIFVQPLVHLVLSYISSVIIFFVYNKLAPVFGGVEIETSQDV